MSTLPPLPYDEHGRYTPAPGTEYEFSISDIARAAAPLLGDDWDAESGCWGVSGTVESPDAREVYYVAVGDVGDREEDLLVREGDNTRLLPGALMTDGLPQLANAVAITIRVMRHNDAEGEPWNVGQHLVAALAAHGRTPVVNFHEGSTSVTLPGNNGMTLVITGTSRTGADVGVEYALDDHVGWTATLRFGASSTPLFRTPDLVYLMEFAEDTAALLDAVLPYAPQ